MTDVLTTADMSTALRLLQENAVPPGPDGFYVLFGAFDTRQDFLLVDIAHRAAMSYRERDIAGALIRHERRRFALGKRDTRPTAEEVLLRSARLENAGLKAAIARLYYRSDSD